MSEQLVKEELYLQIMDGLEKSCRLMAAYDEMPHEQYFIPGGIPHD